MIFDWFNPKAKPTPAPAPAPAPVPEPEAIKQDEMKEEVVEQAESSTTPEPAEAEPAEATAEVEVPPPVTAVHTGTVTWYNPKRGYGFISDLNTDDVDIFVHQSEIQAPGFRFLVKGETVEYQMKKDDKGRLCAIHVTGPDGGDVAITLRRNKRKQQEEEGK